MQLIMHFSAGDGFTYSCDVNLPLEYESAESAIVDFEHVVHIARKEYLAAESHLHDGYFSFGGHMLRFDTFFPDGSYDSPDFYTVDEWFRKHGQV